MHYIIHNSFPVFLHHLGFHTKSCMQSWQVYTAVFPSFRKFLIFVCPT